MNGIHDMGGMHGFGEVDVEENEPVFHEPWQGRVFAMAMFGTPSIPGGFRYMIEKIEPADYLKFSYYEKWMHACTQGLLQRAVISEAELRDKVEYFSNTPESFPQVTTDPHKVNDVAEAIHKPLQLQVSNSSDGSFRVGQIVRAKNYHPRGHTRLPGYCKGKIGIIEKDYGTWTVDDTPPAGQPHAVEHLYRVRFEGRELWGDNAEPNQALYIDMFDSYLENSDHQSSSDAPTA